MNQPKKLHPALAALIVIALVGIVASAVIIINNSTPANDTKKIQDKTAVHDESTHDHSHGATDPVKIPSSTDTSSYKDGTYKATGSYLSPGGRESIELTVTIKDGVITGTSVKNNATDREAKDHQELFSGHYKELIVGKKISDVESLSRVAGSSLTSNGFNNALDQIKDDARV